MPAMVYSDVCVRTDISASFEITVLKESICNIYTLFYKQLARCDDVSGTQQIPSLHYFGTYLVNRYETCSKGYRFDSAEFSNRKG
jgi:hypothetical protein